MRRFTKHFAVPELACNDGTPVPPKYYNNAVLICGRAEVLRAKMGPLHVNSGYRTPSYNKRVGGATASKHLTCSALDLRSVMGVWTGPELAAAYRLLIEEGALPDGGVGEYAGFVHIDLGRSRRWWG